jgi:superfamily II DNA or RNA helicase
MTYDSIAIEQIDNVYLKIHCEKSVAMEISDHFTFNVPGARFTPAFKNKIWDGKIRLFNLANHTIYRGLLESIKQFCEQREYTIEYNSDFSADSFSIEEAKDFIETLNLPNHLELRDYQIKSFTHCIRSKRAVVISPTASGKSLIIYFIARLYNTKTLIIVPTTGLVHQLYSDFIDYGIDENMVHKVFSGQDKDTDKQIVITTWQSIYTLKKPWFEQYNVVIGDECHHFKATSLTSIMTKLINAKYRFGFTGSLDGSLTNELVLVGLFGPKMQVTTTSELIENKYLSPFRIKALVLSYDDDTRKMCAKLDYKDELDFIVQCERRNNFIRNLALSLNGNTLILYQFVEKQGKTLFNKISSKAAQDRKVFFVHGSVDGEQRNDIRYIVEQENNAIIVASYGTFSTGVNIKRIHNIIFASPFKSKIRGLQSIGRGLRKGDDKQIATLFDIADDLKWKSRVNHTLKHFIQRVDIYNQEKFEYKIYNVKIERIA